MDGENNGSDWGGRIALIARKYQVYFRDPWRDSSSTVSKSYTESEGKPVMSYQAHLSCSGDRVMQEKQVDGTEI